MYDTGAYHPGSDHEKGLVGGVSGKVAAAGRRLHLKPLA